MQSKNSQILRSISIRAGDWKWQVNPQFHSIELVRYLEAPEKLVESCTELLRLDPRPRDTLIFQRMFSDLHPVPLIIKRYRAQKMFASLRDRLRPSRALSAFEKALALRALKILSATTVGASQVQWRAGRAESYLITEQIPDACPLREFRATNCDIGKQRRVIRKLADVMARLHEAGWSHSDPSLSNFFVQNCEGGDIRIVLIDLDGIRPKRMDSLSVVGGDLAQLFLRIPMSVSEQCWFVAHYCRVRNISSRKLRAVLTREMAREVPALIQGKTRKIHWQTESGFLSKRVWAVMKKPESFLGDSEFHFKNTRVVTVARVPAALKGDPDLVLRRLNYGKFIHRLKDVFRPSRAQRAFHRGILLEQNGIATARALAAADVRFFGWPFAAYLITEQIREAQPLSRILNQSNPPLKKIAMHLASLLAELHQRNFSHRDLKSSNILFDGDWKPFLIDLDGLSHFRRLNSQRASADLARLAESVCINEKKIRTAGLQFLAQYCRQRSAECNPRRLAGEIAARIAL